MTKDKDTKFEETIQVLSDLRVSEKCLENVTKIIEHIKKYFYPGISIALSSDGLATFRWEKKKAWLLLSVGEDSFDYKGANMSESGDDLNYKNVPVETFHLKTLRYWLKKLNTECNNGNAEGLKRWKMAHTAQKQGAVQ